MEHGYKIVRNSRFCCLQQPDHGVRRRIKSREWQEGTEERDGIREVEMGNEQLQRKNKINLQHFVFRQLQFKKTHISEKKKQDLEERRCYSK